ncbi:MAG: acyl-CoA dehydrogenase family protein [Nocardioides sp.]|uniref:acyl-CoA dehydrogenase family protein n=1 Tax=Nocardioides sp. TaxID=35761 RepID=UPI0039E50F9B
MTLDRPTRRTARLDALRAKYAPVLDKIAAGALQRELDGTLPAEQVAWLKEAGFGALRVPVPFGGDGADWAETTQLWIDLATADQNLAQALRGHFAFVEDRLWHHARGEDQRAWFARFVAGEIAGNAWSEAGNAIETQNTVLSPDGGDWRISGEKFYTTGTIYAEWADTYVRVGGTDDDGGGEPSFAIALVDTRLPGVTVLDDWDGFGQKGTGSGTARFEDVPVAAENVIAFGERYPYQTAVYQLSHLATLAGIGRAALADVVAQVRGRDRNYTHANAPRVRDDAQVLARVGELASATYAVEAIALRAADAVQDVFELAGAADAVIDAANENAELESSAGQVVATELILKVTSDLFDTLGASATSRGRALDRHWRNARTVSSHNPRILKSRVVGAHAVNGTPPPYAWGIGRTRRDTPTATSTTA